MVTVHKLEEQFLRRPLNLSLVTLYQNRRLLVSLEGTDTCPYVRLPLQVRARFRDPVPPTEIENTCLARVGSHAVTGDAGSARRRTAGPWARCIGTGALLGVLLVAGCGEGMESLPDGVAAPQIDTASSTESGYEAPCERKGFPCTWGEVSADALWLTDRLGWMAVDIMERTGSLGAVVEFLRGAEGIAEVWVGDFSVQFRVEGGRPAWVDLPSDPENPRLGGGAGRPPATRRDQNGGGKNGVAASDGRLGEGKHALFLAPVAWHIGGLGSRVKELQEVRDYTKAAKGKITYRANLVPDKAGKPHTKKEANKRIPGDNVPWGDTDLLLSKPVKLEHFENWSEYNFVFLKTHGRAKCEDEHCYTTLHAGQPLIGAEEAARELAQQRGVELVYELTELNNELSDAEREACKSYLDGHPNPEFDVQRVDAGGDGDGTVLEVNSDPKDPSKRCFRPYVTTKSAMVLLATPFFEDVYGEKGLENIIIFLAACQSLKVGDLADVFTNHGRNENVAVFGFDEIADTAWAAHVGSYLIDLMGLSGLDNEAVKDELQRLFPDAPLTGVVLADDVDPADLEPASVVNQASNPTHGRDVVELVNPLTGEELRDGGSLLAVGAPADGQPDAARVQMRVRGIDPETDIDQINVFLNVDGGPGSGPYALAGEVEEYVWDVADDTVELGFDVDRRGSHDLEIRATLEGGGESRWRYEDIRFATCFYHATWTGPFGGSHSSPYIRAHGAQVSFPDPFTNDRGFGMTTRFHGSKSPALETGAFKLDSINATFKSEAWDAVASYDAEGVWSRKLPDPVVRIHEVTDAYVRGTVQASLVMGLSSPKPFDPYAEPLPQEPFHVTVEFQYAKRHGGADCPQP